MKLNGAFVITGAGKGLGSKVAESAFALGYPVALISRTKKDLEQVRDSLLKLKASGSHVSIHAGDLTNERQVQKIFQDIKKSHGWIRALINNAGTWVPQKTIFELRKEDIELSINQNFYSAFHATKSTLDVWKRTGSKELSVINVGATAALQGWPQVTAFCLGKSALRVFSQSLARELGPQGVHVAHVVVDGILDNVRTRKLNPKASKNEFIDLNALAAGITGVALQEKSCWTFEWDVRPFNESW